MIALDILFEGQMLTMKCLYGPNTDSPKFYNNMNKLNDDIGNDTYKICGDFNPVLEP